MCSKPDYISCTLFKINSNNQPVIISFYIENNPTTRNNTCTTVYCFEHIKIDKRKFRKFKIPCQQRYFCFRVFINIVKNSSFCYNVHKSKVMKKVCKLKTYFI